VYPAQSTRIRVDSRCVKINLKSKKAKKFTLARKSYQQHDLAEYTATYHETTKPIANGDGDAIFLSQGEFEFDLRAIRIVKWGRDDELRILDDSATSFQEN
jgi:hypothetical protein